MRTKRQLSNNLLRLFVLILALSAGGCGVFGSGGNSRDDIALLEQDVKAMDQRLTADVNELKNDVREIKGLLTRRPGALSSGTAPGLAALPDSQVESLYKQARALYVQNKYEEAGVLFTRLAEQAPAHKLAPNARYWLAECFYSRKQFAEAMTEFEKTVRDYPASAKAPDAMLKLAYSSHMLGDGKAAMARLHDLLQKYPKSEAARMVKSGQTVFRQP